jgi:hypothetical protein
MASGILETIAGRGAPRLGIEIDGQRASVALSRFAEGIKDWQPFWRGSFAPQFFGDVQANIEAAGAYAHDGGWAPLSPIYALRKAQTHPGRPIMVRDGDLKTSLTWRGALYSESGGAIGYKGIARFSQDGAELGTTVLYATYHQRGVPKRHLPQRRLLFLPSNASVTYGKLMHRFAYEAAKKAKAAE